MSKRPKAANGVMSRLRRPAGRLRDLPIWSKLGLIMLVPTVATIIVGVDGLVDHIEEASNAERARTLSVLSEAAGGLVDHLQAERTYGMMVALAKDAKNNDARTAAIELYNGEHEAVDAAKTPYVQQKGALEDVPANVGTLLLRLDRNLEDLPAFRSKVANGQVETPDVKTTYNQLIDDLLQVRDSSAQLATDPGLSDHLRAVAAVAEAKNYIAQQRFIGHQVLEEGELTTTLRQQFLGTITGFDLAKKTLEAVGTDSEKTYFSNTVSGLKAQAATNYTLPLMTAQGDNAKNIQFNTNSWEEAMKGYNDLFRQVEVEFDKNIVASATTLRDDTNQRVFLETSLLLALLLLGILFAWLVARSMARSLRELRQGALAVAQFGLPHAVSRLRDPALSASLTPAQVADQIAEPLPVRSRDEFGQVTEAFNAVHLEAVRTAAEQAALRASVATMFVNLARRSQILVDRLIGHLDRLERGEEDPDRLAELFQLDHLATRMRRNDENLLVLAGADSTRVQREPAALIDVLRAAQSEVEHYTRIEFGQIDREIEVAAHAVNDMVHLVAELFDNATAFSPPNSNVLVEARRIGDNAVLTVEDHGIGISREQLRDLNERLANPPTVDVAVSRMMGLVVVARLANRHAVRVELRPADRERGTVAEVGLPASVLAAAASARVQSMVGFDSPPPAMPSFGEPLALESGRGGLNGGGPGVNGGGHPFEPMNGTNGSVPAWSDLTGAAPTGFGGLNGNGAQTNGTQTNGTQTNGFANGFHGPRSNEVIPPLPSGPQGFAGLDELAQRRNGEFPRPEDTNGFGAAIPRQLPANPENLGRGPVMPPVSAPPVPPVSAPPVPSAPPYSPPISAAPAEPVSAAPVSAEPVNPFASAPPAWPPVAADREQAATPHVPENLAAALDMTAEIPRYRPDNFEPQPQVARPTNPQTAPVSAVPQVSAPPAPVADDAAAAARAGHETATAQAAEAQATAAAQIAAAQASARQREGGVPFADETMELPIFRELESAWFTTTHPGDQPRPEAARTSGADAGDESVVSARRIPTGEPTRSAGVPQQAGSPESRDFDTATVGAPAAAVSGSYSNGSTATNPWRTAADDGWQAARAAAETQVDTTTTAGLPKRTPMAQLVPGGVDRGGNSVQRRTPEGVRGLLSAYHRGVQRGRTKEQSTNLEETPGGQQPSQAGKEHEA
ncbi:putative sensor-like histidine kinase [Actinoplanes missouriensis 431]|uniref:histidine kinase n=1 Tax=Actinoplanes missouriensis (strain ATCC 14538 / DSM 43046 / CBS 188.64 / JCM 3121 / NBRC 102363 / NCIMB 12654 / NRRL B-3342 / UNCC 431) TaxID=512565 RepID=I0HI60_ACTM4|nr:nitrate- and nitrite sensing domain-containing protein [Actinoplanes missouriensis]BAL92697.1 putative sensor-like histidine kinase [Actinoplanes missouriensis 431]